MTPDDPRQVSQEPGAPDDEIPSFKREESERKGGAMPLLGPKTVGKPSLRVRGLGSGTSLIDRLKQFKKKDLAFIASGLGVLFLAPVAEHFLMGPRDDTSVLRQGFDSKGNLFSDVSPYEPGTGGFSPGGLPGQSTDVITPLNVRDPASLILGPGATQQPAAAVGAPPPPPKSDAGDWKNALSEAAKGAAGKAAEAGPLPFNKGNLAGAVRGLSALSGASYGGGPTYSLPPVGSSGVPSTPNQRGFNRVNPSADYRGVAPRSGTQSSSGWEQARAAADRQGNIINRPGAGSSLEQAAREAIPSGGGGLDDGGPGSGDKNKDPGGNAGKDNKSLGESLAFLRAKMEMEKAIDLKWKKKEWLEFERSKMIQSEFIKAGIAGVQKAFIDPIADGIASLLPMPGNNQIICVVKPGPDVPKGLPNPIIFSNDAQRRACLGLQGGKEAKGTTANCEYYRKPENRQYYSCAPAGDDKPVDPSGDTRGGGAGPDNVERNAQRRAAEMAQAQEGFKRADAQLDAFIKEKNCLASPSDADCALALKLKDSLSKLRDQGDISAKVKGIHDGLDLAQSNLKNAQTKLLLAVTSITDANGKLKDPVLVQGGEALKALVEPAPEAVVAALGEAGGLLEQARQKLDVAPPAVPDRPGAEALIAQATAKIDAAQAKVDAALRAIAEAKKGFDGNVGAAGCQKLAAAACQNGKPQEVPNHIAEALAKIAIVEPNLEAVNGPIVALRETVGPAGARARSANLDQRLSQAALDIDNGLDVVTKDYAVAARRIAAIKEAQTKVQDARLAVYGPTPGTRDLGTAFGRYDGAQEIGMKIGAFKIVEVDFPKTVSSGLAAAPQPAGTPPPAPPTDSQRLDQVRAAITASQGVSKKFKDGDNGYNPSLTTLVTNGGTETGETVTKVTAAKVPLTTSGTAVTQMEQANSR